MRRHVRSRRKLTFDRKGGIRVLTHSEPTAPLRKRMRLTRFSRPTRRTVSLQSVGNLWAAAASDIEGPRALELSANRQYLSKCGEPSSGVTPLRCNPRDRVPPRRPRASAGGSIAADPSNDGPYRHGPEIDNRGAFCRTQR